MALQIIPNCVLLMCKQTCFVLLLMENLTLKTVNPLFSFDLTQSYVH